MFQKKKKTLWEFSRITKTLPNHAFWLLRPNTSWIRNLCQNLLKAGYGSLSLQHTCNSWDWYHLRQLAKDEWATWQPRLAGVQAPPKHPFSHFLLTRRPEPAHTCQKAIRCNLYLAVLVCPRGVTLEAESDLKTVAIMKRNNFKAIVMGYSDYKRSDWPTDC